MKDAKMNAEIPEPFFLLAEIQYQSKSGPACTWGPTRLTYQLYIFDGT